MVCVNTRFFLSNVKTWDPLLPFSTQSKLFSFLFQVRKAVINTFVTAVLYNIPRYFEYEFVYSPEYGIYDFDKTALGHHLVYRYIYNLILYALCLFFIPLLLLIVLNAKLVWALQKGKKTMGDLTISTKERTEPNSDTTVYCAGIFYWWNTSFNSQHDRFSGPICHR